MRRALACLAVLTAATAAPAQQVTPPGFAAHGVPFTAVRFTDGFWRQRQQTALHTTVPYCLDQCGAKGKIKHFRVAAGLEEGAYTSIFPFDDSDVYKALEGAANALSLENNPTLAARVGEMVAAIAAAQEEDGYLQTWRTIDPDRPPCDWAGTEGRWSNLASGHELYNVGHLYEAAVAHYRATGKRDLLDVAIRNADLLNRVFGPDRLVGTGGHPEIELALVKLGQATGNAAYIDLGEFFLDVRGRDDLRNLFGLDLQDHRPLVEQTEAVGHVVRALYLYCGMADIAASRNRADYLATCLKLWDDIVGRKLYLTGGLGCRHNAEAFGEPYQLPNREAYNETCGAIAHVLFNHRLALLLGDARFVDVLERSLYNGVLAGISLSGDTFCYRNPLETDPSVYGGVRQAWIDVACCPTNLARLLTSVGQYLYATDGDRLYVNLYADSTATVDLAGAPVRITQQTRYPWQGQVELTVDPGNRREFTLCVRIPGWLRQPVPSELYHYDGEAGRPYRLGVNGQAIDTPPHRGYVAIRRAWQDGDTVVLDLPMPVRRVRAHGAVAADRGMVALQRGPLVYCFEGVDNAGDLGDITLPDAAGFSSRWQADRLDGIVVIEAVVGDRTYTAIPFYTRANREPTAMAVWVAADQPPQTKEDTPLPGALD